MASQQSGSRQIEGKQYTIRFSPALLIGSSTHTWVSLKILTAKSTESSQELHNINIISQLIHEEPEPRQLSRLKGHFYHEGPNGKHLCLVLEFLGPSLRIALNFCKYNESEREYLRPSTVIRISEQLLRIIASLHSVGIAHGGTLSLPFFVAVFSALRSC